MTNTLLTPAKQKKLVNFGIGLFRFVFIVGICYLFLFPVLNMLITSFKSLATADDPTIVWIPKGLSLEGIKTSMAKLNYKQSAPLTLVITVFSTFSSNLLQIIPKVNHLQYVNAYIKKYCEI